MYVTYTSQSANQYESPSTCWSLQLVRAREGDGSYVPIPEGDVAAAKMPPLREPDAYLKSRLDQFYAELQARAPS